MLLSLLLHVVHESAHNAQPDVLLLNANRQCLR